MLTMEAKIRKTSRGFIVSKFKSIYVGFTYFYLKMEVQPLVVDMGSGICRAGFAGDDAPRSVFRTVLGRSRYRESDTRFIGDEAMAKKSQVTLTVLLCLIAVFLQSVSY
jgi:hypothetical protein